MLFRSVTVKTWEDKIKISLNYLSQDARLLLNRDLKRWDGIINFANNTSMGVYAGKHFEVRYVTAGYPGNYSLATFLVVPARTVCNTNFSKYSTLYKLRCKGVVHENLSNLSGFGAFHD